VFNQPSFAAEPHPSERALTPLRALRESKSGALSASAEDFFLSKIAPFSVQFRVLSAHY
jgi:hypothetical protein